MLASSDSGRIAFQPEDRREEQVLYRLFSLVEPPDCWFTLDVAEYDDLDEGFARRAANDGPFAPGTRALVVDAPALRDEEAP